MVVAVRRSRGRTPARLRVGGAVASLCLVGCARGEVQWADGHDVLRTAWWQRATIDGSVRVQLALSTSEFPCALDLTGDDPAEITRTQIDLQTGACREGARHVVVDLWQGSGQPGGLYPGYTGGVASTLAEVDRFASASYYAVDEAGVLYVDGINRAYAPLEGGVEYWPALGDGGSVRVEGFDGADLDGWFSFPEAGIAGSFRARECPAGAELLDDLFDAVGLLQVGC